MSIPAPRQPNSKQKQWKFGSSSTAAASRFSSRSHTNRCRGSRAERSYGGSLSGLPSFLRFSHLLVRVESVDDQREELVDVSRESEGLCLCLRCRGCLGFCHCACLKCRVNSIYAFGRLALCVWWRDRGSLVVLGGAWGGRGEGGAIVLDHLLDSVVFEVF